MPDWLFLIYFLAVEQSPARLDVSKEQILPKRGRSAKYNLKVHQAGFLVFPLIQISIRFTWTSEWTSSRTLTFSYFRKTKWNGSQSILVKTFRHVLNRRQQEVQNSSKVPGELHVSCFLCPFCMDSQARTLPYRFLSTAPLLYYTQIVSAATGEGEMATRYQLVDLIIFLL